MKPPKQPSPKKKIKPSDYGSKADRSPPPTAANGPEKAPEQKPESPPAPPPPPPKKSPDPSKDILSPPRPNSIKLEIAPPPKSPPKKPSECQPNVLSPPVPISTKPKERGLSSMPTTLLNVPSDYHNYMPEADKAETQKIKIKAASVMQAVPSDAPTALVTLIKAEEKQKAKAKEKAKSPGPRKSPRATTNGGSTISDNGSGDSQVSDGDDQQSAEDKQSPKGDKARSPKGKGKKKETKKDNKKKKTGCSCC